MTTKKTVKVNRMAFETGSIEKDKFGGFKNHGPFKITMILNDTEHAWTLEKMVCFHCEFGFWNVRAGDYGNIGKEAYIVEEFNLKEV